MDMATADLNSHIQSALQCITSPSPPGMIQQAQQALLQWEETQTDQYVVCLTSLVGVTTSGAVEEQTSAATQRLAAVLALKAAVGRRWKDKGRGKVGAPKNLLNEGVKTLLRQSVLNLVLIGKFEQGQNNQTSFITNPNEITSQQVELIQDRPLQTNAASLLSKIARMDLPLKWHELIPSLVEGTRRARGTVHQIKQQLQSEQMQQHHELIQTVLYNSMNSLEAVLSEISTQRLLVNTKYRNLTALQHLGSMVESGLIPSFQDVESLRNASGTGEYHISVLQYATLTSRVVSHMMISSFSKLVEDASSLVDQILSLIHSFLSQWLPFVLDGKNMIDNNLREPLKELLHVHCELIVNLQSSHPVAFATYLNPFLILFHSSLMGIVGLPEERNQRVANVGPYVSNRFTIAFLSFLANVVGTSKYTESDTTKNELLSFFTPSLVKSLSQTLLQLFSFHIFPTQSSHDDDENDAVLWQDEAEAFYHWEMNRSSEEDSGCAAQNLFLALVESSLSSDAILHWLIGLLTNVESQRLAVEVEAGISAGIDAQVVLLALPLGIPSTKLSHGANVAIDLMLQWDAIYTAAGLTGSILEKWPGFDFRLWFDATLGPCSALLSEHRTQQQTQLPILERRIIWLISCNAHQVPISSVFNPLGMLASAISAQNACVRLTAVQAMDALLPQCEEVPSLLHSIIETTAPALYHLVIDCAEVESRSSCLDLLSNLICVQTRGSLTNDILNLIITPLPSIWDNAIDENLLLKRSVLTILSCIASSVGPESCSVLYPLALPMIDDSFAREENVFLVEEALKIWWVFLRLSKTYDPLLGKLFVRAMELSKDLEHLMILMRVTEHYIILGGANFLHDHAATIQTVLSNVVGEVRPRGTAFIFLVVEALLRSFPVEGGLLLKNCGVLKTLTEACAGNYFEDDKCEPDRVIVLYLTALARVLLYMPDTLQLPLQLASGHVFGEEDLIELYLRKWHHAGNGAHGLLFQKLWALLLLSFYPPCRSAFCRDTVLRKTSTIFNMFVHMLKNENPDGTNVLSYEVGYEEEEESIHVGEDTYEALLQEQRTKDIVLSTSLQKAISTKMNGLHIELGQSYQEFHTIENDSFRQLEEVLANNRY